MGVSKNRGPQHRPPFIIILIIRTPEEGPLIFGTPHMILQRGVARLHLRSSDHISREMFIFLYCGLVSVTWSS